MEISDDEANMIAGRIFDAIEAKGLFNRELVATEIKAGLALVKAPVKRSGSARVDEAMARAYRDAMVTGTGYVYLAPGTVLKKPSETEGLLVKAMEDLLGMPLSPGKRDPDGTAHYRLPDTRKETPAERAKRELLYGTRLRDPSDDPF